MSRIVVIADDLTGAADAGVMFCPHFKPVHLCSDRTFASQASLRQAEVLAIHTDSRAATPEAAGSQLRVLLEKLRHQPPARLFKKIDSSLRGNIGAEIDTIVEQTDAACSFVTAAFPELGRTTVHDIHAIDGVPLAETELRHDPATPVTESRVTVVIGRQSRYPLGHIDLPVLDGPFADLVATIDRLRSSGCRHLVFDATTDAHLDRIVALAGALKDRVLLVGTAGLAMAAARQWATGSVAGMPEDLPARVEGYPLYLCGTAAAMTARQIETLVTSSSCALVNLDPGLLADGTRRAALQRRTQDLLGTPRTDGLLIRITPEEDNNRPRRQGWPALAVAQGLGLVAAELVKAHPPAAIFCCGGDTASSVMAAVGAWSMELRRLIVPGMVLGRLNGGVVAGLPFITKPGSFGRAEDLVTLHHLLTKK
ncbi:MAG: four-carbon acid sugar kinase family protein [Pelovirga sp.]